MSGPLLFVRDIAARRRISVSAAREWLAELERMHGPGVIVGRRGKRLFTTDVALARAVTGWEPAASDVPTLRRLEQRVSKAWARVTGLIAAMRVFHERLNEVATVVEHQTGRRFAWRQEAEITIG